jgi:hypothetical protein
MDVFSRRTFVGLQSNLADFTLCVTVKTIMKFIYTLCNLVVFFFFLSIF